MPARTRRTAVGARPEAACEKLDERRSAGRKSYEVDRDSRRLTCKASVSDDNKHGNRCAREGRDHSRERINRLVNAVGFGVRDPLRPRLERTRIEERVQHEDRKQQEARDQSVLHRRDPMRFARWPQGGPWALAPSLVGDHAPALYLQGGSDFDLDQLVALCRRCHELTDAPYIKGRLVVTPLGDGLFRFDRRGDPQSGTFRVDQVLTVRAASQMCRAEITTTADDTVRTGSRTWRLVIPPHTMVAATIARIRARRVRPNLKASAKTRALDAAFRRRVDRGVPFGTFSAKVTAC